MQSRIVKYSKLNEPVRGMTPLLFAAIEIQLTWGKSGRRCYRLTQCMSVLIEHGANVNFRSSCGSTALMNVNNHVGAVKLLLAAGADATLVDCLGKTAYREMLMDRMSARRRRKLRWLLGQHERRQRWQRAISLAAIIGYWSKITVDLNSKLFAQLCTKYNDW